MATQQDLLKARFTMVRQDLNQVLDRITDADMSWAPREGMKAIGDQLVEIAIKEIEVVTWIREGAWVDEDAEAFEQHNSTVERMRATLQALRRETFAYIDSLSESDLDEPIPCKEGWWEALRLTECPRSEILRNIAAHEWYHTGQLVSYLWMRGDDPNAW